MEDSPPQLGLPPRLLPHDHSVHAAAGLGAAPLPPRSYPEAIPESHCSAVLTALRALQSKLRTLEIERTRAQENYHELEREAALQRLRMDRMRMAGQQAEASTVQQMQSKLLSAEDRSRRLEIELAAHRRELQRLHELHVQREEQERRTAAVSQQFSSAGVDPNAAPATSKSSRRVTIRDDHDTTTTPAATTPAATTSTATTPATFNPRRYVRDPTPYRRQPGESILTEMDSTFYVDLPEGATGQPQQVQPPSATPRFDPTAGFSILEETAMRPLPDSLSPQRQRQSGGGQQAEARPTAAAPASGHPTPSIASSRAAANIHAASQAIPSPPAPPRYFGLDASTQYQESPRYRSAAATTVDAGVQMTPQQPRGMPVTTADKSMQMARETTAATTQTPYDQEVQTSPTRPAFQPRLEEGEEAAAQSGRQQPFAAGSTYNRNQQQRRPVFAEEQVFADSPQRPRVFLREQNLETPGRAWLRVESAAAAETHDQLHHIELATQEVLRRLKAVEGRIQSLASTEESTYEEVLELRRELNRLQQERRALDLQRRRTRRAVESDFEEERERRREFEPEERRDVRREVARRTARVEQSDPRLDDSAAELPRWRVGPETPLSDDDKPRSRRRPDTLRPDAAVVDTKTATATSSNAMPKWRTGPETPISDAVVVVKEQRGAGAPDDTFVYTTTTVPEPPRRPRPAPRDLPTWSEEGQQQRGRFEAAASQADRPRPTALPPPPQPPAPKSYMASTFASRAKAAPVPTDVFVGHFHFNDVPFVVGTSITPSQSVGGNLQQLLAKLKRRGVPNPFHAAIVRGGASPDQQPREEDRERASALERDMEDLAKEYEQTQLALNAARARGEIRRSAELQDMLDSLMAELDRKADQFSAILRRGQQPSAAVSASHRRAKTVEVDARDLHDASKTRQLLHEARRLQRNLDREGDGAWE